MAKSTKLSTKLVHYLSRENAGPLVGRSIDAATRETGISRSTVNRIFTTYPGFSETKTMRWPKEYYYDAELANNAARVVKAQVFDNSIEIAQLEEEIDRLNGLLDVPPDPKVWFKIPNWSSEFLQPAEMNSEATQQKVSNLFTNIDIPIGRYQPEALQVIGWNIFLWGSYLHAKHLNEN